MTAKNATIKVWHHAAFVSDGNRSQAFIDGNSVATGGAGLLESFRIGGGFEGKIDEIAVYPRAIPVKRLYRPNRFSK